MINFKNALVIDDEQEIGLLLSTLLGKLGMEAKYANNLDKGLTMFKDQCPQVVFLDLNLPDGSGFSLVPKMKNGPAATKVIIITARDGANERSMAKKLGVDYVLSKPLSRNGVVEVLERLSTNGME